MVTKTNRIRRARSVSNELLVKSREAALSAVQIFNSPLITFKAEIFIVLMTIAWTYLLHAYYRNKKIEYRYFEQREKRRVFQKTVSGAHKFWGLEKCLTTKQSPIDIDTANNLRFLIGIRHEIEHQMTTKLDASFSAKFQACCLNYNDYIKSLFGEKLGIDKYLSVSLQFTSISEDQVESLPTSMPAHIKAFIDGFEGNLSVDAFNNPRFAYRVLFVPKKVNRKGQADQVIEFVAADSEFGKSVNATYTILKETERKKYLPSKVVKIMVEEGFGRFLINDHTDFWKSQNAQNPDMGYGAWVEGKWYWYESWIEKVREYCKQNQARFQGIKNVKRNK
jgi:hypothetical protein